MSSTDNAIANNKKELDSQDVVQTTHPDICCTQPPEHWRYNKSLPTQFRVLTLCAIPDDTEVVVTASNEFEPNAKVKNPVAHFKNCVAVFSDLRFLGKSGRGKKFTITMTIKAMPHIVAHLEEAIKITVDGPRQPRRRAGSSKSDEKGWRSASASREPRRVSASASASASAAAAAAATAAAAAVGVTVESCGSSSVSSAAYNHSITSPNPSHSALHSRRSTANSYQIESSAHLELDGFEFKSLSAAHGCEGLSLTATLRFPPSNPLSAEVVGFGIVFGGATPPFVPGGIRTNSTAAEVTFKVPEASQLHIGPGGEVLVVALMMVGTTIYEAKQKMYFRVLL